MGEAQLPMDDVQVWLDYQKAPGACASCPDNKGRV